MAYPEPGPPNLEDVTCNFKGFEELLCELKRVKLDHRSEPSGYTGEGFRFENEETKDIGIRFAQSVAAAILSKNIIKSTCSPINE